MRPMYLDRDETIHLLFPVITRKEEIMNQNTKTLGQRIKEQRVKVGLTQEELADIMYLPKSTISAYENGTHIKDDRLLELADALQTTPNDLLGVEADPYIVEMTDLLKKLDNPMVRDMLMKQVKALV